MSPQRKELEKQLKIMCQEMGFKKFKYDYQKPINDNFCVNIMFTCASYQIKYHILVAPSIGIISNQIENIFEQCAELTCVKDHDATIQTNLGYLMPQKNYIEWDYSEQSDPNVIFSEMRETIERYGYPFYDRYSDMDNITDAIKSGKFHTTKHRDLLLSIICYLRNDKAMALKYLDSLVKKRMDQRGLEIFEKRFNENFRKLLQ